MSTANPASPSFDLNMPDSRSSSSIINSLKGSPPLSSVYWIAWFKAVLRPATIVPKPTPTASVIGRLTACCGLTNDRLEVAQVISGSASSSERRDLGEHLGAGNGKAFGETQPTSRAGEVFGLRGPNRASATQHRS